MAGSAILGIEGRALCARFVAELSMLIRLVGKLRKIAGQLADLSDLIERVRLFCTFYDAKKGRYAFDYSFFISLAVGSLALLCLAVVLVRAWLRSGRFPGNPA